MSDRYSPTVIRLVDAVTARTGVSDELIYGRSRLASIAWARHLTMWLIRHALNWSYPEIGRLFDRDHTTVMHACSRVAGARRVNPELRRWLDQYASPFAEVEP